MMFLSSRLLPPCLALILLAMSIDGMACSGRLHIEVQDSGVYALDYAAVVAQQPQLKDCASNDLVLLNRGKEVPIRVRDDDHGRFAAGARIEWVGQALHGPESWYDQYSAVNVYLLAAAPGSHARMHEVHADAKAAGVSKSLPLRRNFHFEQENLMLRLSDREMKAGEEPDVWQWAKLTPIDATPFTYGFDAPDADLSAPNTADVSLTLDFRGVSNVVVPPKTSKPADHVVEVSLNGKVLATFSWDGRDEMHRQLSVARALLKEKGNSLRLTVPRRPAPNDAQNFIVDVAMFNWMEVSYPMRGNLAASTAPFVTSGDAAIELQGKPGQVPQLYGSDGTWHVLTALGNDRFRAAGAAADVDLFPLLDDKLPAPALIRPVVDRDLHADTRGDDYLMVAHPRLLQAIEPLARFHREHGHKVAVVDVDEVYDQFNDGIIHPRAIRNFVAWGMQHWTTKPRYLLLVGDASFDIHHDQRSNHATAGLYALRAQPFRDEMIGHGGGLSNMATTPYAHWDPALANRNLIPTWQFPTPEGQSATDNDFVALKNGDFHPQLAVGRLPVVEPEEVKAIVDKTIAYLSKPAPGPWHRDVTFISTNEVASFKQVSDKIAAGLEDRGFAVNSIYTNIDGKDALNARATLKDDLNAGNLLVHFIGHGGQFIWRVGPPAELFTLDDVSSLKNVGRYPIVLAMTCFSAPFDHPTEDSIGERFLREPDKGAVAVFAASWENWPNPDYSRALIEQLLKPGQSIGDAIVAAKAKATDRIFVQMYNLLGDPAVVLAQPPESLQFSRSPDRWNPRVLVRVPGHDFGGDVDVDWIDAQDKTLATQHYQARDAQFALSPVDKATQVRVYAADTRNGRSAFGSFSLVEPPKPVVAAAAGKAPPRGPKSRAASPHPGPQTVHPGKQADTITQAGFDNEPLPQPAVAGAAAKHE